MGNLLGFADTAAYVWIIPIVFCIHEFEEWNILRWYRKYYRDMPESTETSVHIHIVALSAAAFVLTLAAYLLRTTPVFAAITVFLSGFILMNTVQHVIWTVQLHAYSPGLVTALFATAAAVYANVELAAAGHIAPIWYAAVLVFVLPIVKTFRVKGELTPEVRAVHEFFIKVEQVIRTAFARTK